MDLTNLNEESLSYDDDEFYEKIEAPKFVDFNVPDRSKPDDSAWFCLRVGCNQTHEVMDPDALYKSFVIRVMAARSPNLRLRRMLNRPSEIAKCPQSAPAKSAKDRVPRFSTITSVKVRRPLSKIKSSPSSGTAKQHSVTAKALTTPRNKKSPPNPEPFSSVRNPKVTIVNPKNRVVAKALDFHTPKKAGRTISSKYRTPISDIRAEMKKLEISTQRNNVQGHFCKSSRCAVHETKNYVPQSGPAKSHIRTRKLQSNRATILYGSGNPKRQEPSSAYSKKKSKENLQKGVVSSPQEEIDRDSSDMEIDGKSRSDSLEEACFMSIKTKDESLPSSDETLATENTAKEESLPSSDEPLVIENLQSVLSKITTFNYPNSLQNEEEKKDLEEIHQDEAENPETSDKENTSAADGNRPLIISDSESNYQKDLEEKLTNEVQTMDNPDKENINMESSDKENTSASDGNRPLMTSVRENLQSAVSDVTSFNYPNYLSNNEKDLEESHRDEIQTMDDPNKENALASDGNRDMNLNINHSESETHANDVCQSSRKVIRITGKASHQSSTVVTAAQGGKCKIAKPTKPIPFRLRTDERGILKEAKLERNLHLLAPLKEIAPGSAGLPSGNLQRRSENEVQQNGKPREECRYNSATQGGSQIESDKRVQKIEPKKVRTVHFESDRCAGLKMAVKNTPQRQKLVDTEKGTQKMQRLTSPALPRQLVRTQRVAAARKAAPVSLVSPSQIVVVKKTYAATSRAKEALCEVPAAENGTTAAGRASFRGKRSLTIPKEPNFHEIHVPKSCTKKTS